MGSPAQTRDREIVRLALPAFAALVAEPLYVLADTAVVGHLGTAQLGGLAVASAVLLTVHAMFVFLAYGTTSTVSRLLGAGDEARAAHQAVQALWLAAAIGVALSGAVAVAAEPLVEILGASGAVRSEALVYLRISLFGVPALLVALAGTGYLRGLQDTRSPLVVSIAGAVVNLVLELVLIQGFGYGIGASALSTVVAQVGTAAAYVAWTWRGARRSGVGWRPDLVAVAGLARVGVHLFVRTVALRASLTLGTAVAARIGVAELGAHQVAFEIWSFLALALDALAIAGQALTGRLLGAGHADEARAAARRMLEWGVMAGVVFLLVVLAVRPVLPAIFTDDPDVQRLASFLLLYVAVLQPVNAVVFVLDGVLIGAGDMRFLAGAMVGAAAVFVPAAVAVAVTGAGIGWVWGALALLMAARFVALAARFGRDRWVVTGLGSAG